MPYASAKGLQVWAGPIDTPLLTLATVTALQISSTYQSIQTGILVKRFRLNATVRGLTIGEGPFAIFLYSGNATVGELQTAYLAGNTAGPMDVTQSQTMDTAWTIWKNSEVMGVITGDGTTVQFNADISLGKGIPALAAPDAGIGGVSLAIINLDDASLTTGAEVQGLYQLWGVWLND